MEDRKITIELPVNLGPKELAERSKKLGEKIHERAKLDGERAAQVAAFRGQLKEIDQEISYEGEVIRTGQEERMVECTVRPDFEDGAMVITRDDTGEVVERREMSPGERQRALELGEVA